MIELNDILYWIVSGLISVPIWFVSQIIIRNRWENGFVFYVSEIGLYFMAIVLGVLSLVFAVIFTVCVIIASFRFWKRIGNYYRSVENIKIFDFEEKL